MKIAYFSNYLNHHQLPLAEAFNSIEGIEYTFVSVISVPHFRIELGYREMETPFLLDVSKSPENKKHALELAVNADIAIFSTSRMEEYIVPRLNSGKLTFECSERWFKKKFKLNVFSRNLWKHQILYYKYGRKANLYMLCASAYAANDYYLLNSFKNRCFKWAYFTRFTSIDINAILSNKRSGKFRIMWCSRFIKWKHPELVIYLAEILKANGFCFEINMFGGGPLEAKIHHSIERRGLAEHVRLKGALVNDRIIVEMQNHHVLLFTSDQNEGWGAVANEAMSNGCTIIGSDQIGSIPFLVKHMENGLIFKSKNINSLYNCVLLLMNNRDLCENLARKAYGDMMNVWSPQNAASRFLNLVSTLQRGANSDYSDGPCSLAEPI